PPRRGTAEGGAGERKWKTGRGGARAAPGGGGGGAAGGRPRARGAGACAPATPSDARAPPRPAPTGGRGPAAPPPPPAAAESGALRGLAFDIAEDIGLDLVDLNDDNSPALRAVLPDFVPVSNPTDITALGLSEPEIYTKVLTCLLEDERIGSVVASIIQSDPITSGIKFPHIIKVLEDGTFPKPLVFAGVDEGANVPQEYIEGLRKVGIPWFPSTERAYRAIARLADLAKRDLTDRSAEPIAVPGL